MSWIKKLLGGSQSVDFQKGKDAYQVAVDALAEFILLAEAGDTRAQMILAMAYYDEKNIVHDYAEAVKWLNLAAEAGNNDAQHILGEMYYFGKGVTQDYEEAAKWTRLSAEAGNFRSHYNLGLMYFNGEGVSQDYCLAYMWFKLVSTHSMSQGDKNASEYALTGYAMAASNMSPEQIAEADEMTKNKLVQILNNKQKKS